MNETTLICPVCASSAKGDSEQRPCPECPECETPMFTFVIIDEPIDDE